MSSIATEKRYIYSSLAADPDLSDIVEMFVEEMPGRVETLATCLADGEWDRLARVAHQMKGACGSYGFHQLTDYAARLEDACRTEPDERTITEAVEELAELCNRVRAGSQSR